MSAEDELTATICLAVRRLTQIKKAGFLLNIALALIEDGQYGEEVETYLDVCLKTPGLPWEDMEKALLAQSDARKLGEQLQPISLNRQIHFSVDPACQRISPEIWEQIAAQIPRYHLRTWLFLSPFHREIASRYIFHTIDMYFLEFEDLDRGLDILDHAINDPVFANRVKSLRLHWVIEEGDTVDLIFRILKISLPAFKALRDFEWIGNPDMPPETVQVLLNSHKHLHGLGLRGWHFEALEVSAFRNLRKFTFRFNDDDEEANLRDIRAVLDSNEGTLKHLILGGSADVDGSLDLAFESVTIKNLTHLDLFGTDVSGFVLDRVAHAHNLQSLTLDGSFEDPGFASEMFATDHIVGGTHTFLPHLEAFRFDMEDEDEALNHSVIHFLRKRERLRRLDLGTCPWDVVQGVLPDLTNLRVLAVCIDELSQEVIKSLVEAIPTQMVAIKLAVGTSDRPLDEYAHYFTRFNQLSFLRLQSSTHPPKPDNKSKEDFETQTGKSLRSIAATIPSLDFLAYHGELCVVVRSHGDTGPAVELKKLPASSNLEYGSGVDILSEDTAWLQQTDLPMEF